MIHIAKCLVLSLCSLGEAALTQQASITYVNSVGGSVFHEKEDDSKPVRAVTLRKRVLTRLDLEKLEGLTSLRGLQLCD